MVWGIFSLALRQGGHAIFEPPCHDEEELLLGFNTKSKCFVFGSYIVAPTVFSSLADGWFAVTFFFILGHTALLWLQYGFCMSMVWFVKLVTDPITDILAYNTSLYTILSTEDWKTGSLATFTQHWNKTPKIKLKVATD
jgi:glutamate-1-semialdehyde 2,1-aminomutase